MHIVTKIFVVLVALLSVAAVPFVIVQGANEATFRSRFESEKSAAEAARADLSTSRTNHARIESDLQAAVQAGESQAAQLSTEIERKSAELAQAGQELERVRAQKAQLEANIAVFAETGRSQDALIGSLTKELHGLRERAVDAERALVEVSKQLELVSSDFDAAQSAVMALQEEVVQLREVAAAAPQAATAPVEPPAADDAPATAPDATVEPQVKVRARVTGVARVGDKTFVAFDQGSRAGVKAGWVLSVSDGDTYIADIKVIQVDDGDAVGEVIGSPEAADSVAEGQDVQSQLGA